VVASCSLCSWIGTGMDHGQEKDTKVGALKEEERNVNGGGGAGAGLHVHNENIK